MSAVVYQLWFCAFFLACELWIGWNASVHHWKWAADCNLAAKRSDTRQHFGLHFGPFLSICKDHRQFLSLIIHMKWWTITLHHAGDQEAFIFSLGRIIWWIWVRQIIFVKSVEMISDLISVGKLPKPTLAPMSIHCQPQGMPVHNQSENFASPSPVEVWVSKFLRLISSWSLHAMDDNGDENMNWM